MKKIIRKILSKKRNVVILTILLIAVIGAASYTINGIEKNVTAMGELDPSVPYFPDYPAVNTQGKDPSLVKRGEYLAKAGDCMACHTNAPEKGTPFAGGLPMPTPFGTIYSPNITPDKETGIGNWTEEQFIKAMKQGISPQGHYYYPAFPYIYFNNVSIEDLKAIKAYLDSIPPVKQKNRDNEMVWPFNQRVLQLPWRLMFFHPEENNNTNRLGTTEGAPQTEQLKRGSYLVEGLGHCAMCHSPSYHIFSEQLSLGAPIRKYSLTGAKVVGFLAPDISKKNLATVPLEEIINVFTKDTLIGGGRVEGPMLEVNHDSLRYLSRSDLEAIALYLKSVQSKSPPKPSGGTGKVIYESYCVGCHASGGGGAPKFGDGASWDPILSKGMTTVYDHAIQGIAGMPAKGTCISCSPDDIKQAVNYMVAAVTGPGGKIIHVAKPKPLTMADGKRIYDNNCSVCHASGFKGAPKPGDKTVWKPIIANGFIETYLNVETGRKGHPPHGACMECSDNDLIAAVKYMMQQSATDTNYNLW